MIDEKLEEEKLLTKNHMGVMKVLVADDDLPTRMLLGAAIKQWGYEITEAADGEEAWKILTSNEPPPLLVVDWLMPKLDGIGLCQRIQENLNFHPYIILLTQVTGTSNIVKALNAGADEFLTKPFNMAELQSRLKVGEKIVNYENELAIRNEELKKYATRMEFLAQERARELVSSKDFALAKDISEMPQVKDEMDEVLLDVVRNLCEILKKEKEATIKVVTTMIKDKNALVVTVECSGQKISNELLEKILKPYWKIHNKDEKTLGDNIKVEASTKAGIRFTLNLPIK